MTVLKHPLQRTLKSPASWILVAMAWAILAYYFFNRIDQYVILQEQNQVAKANLSNFAAVPLFAQFSQLLLVIIAALSPRGLLSDRRLGTLPLLLGSPLSAIKISLSHWVSLLFIPLVLWFFTLTLCSVLGIFTPLDWGLIFTAAVGVLLVMLALSAIALWVSSLITSATASMVISFMAMICIWFIDFAAINRGVANSILGTLSFSSRLRDFFGGEIVLSSALYFLSMTIAFVYLSSISLRKIKAQPYRVRKLLAVCFIVLAAWTSNQFNQRWDFTAQSKNSLSPTSLALLSQLKTPLDVLVFSSKELSRNPPLMRYLERYQRASTQIQLKRLNPSEHLQQVRELDVRQDNVVFLSLDNRQVRVDPLTEIGFAKALIQIHRSHQPFVAYAYGSGERDFRGAAGFDLGRFGSALNQRGINLQPFDLLLNPAPPDNAELLILTASAQQRIPAVLDAVSDYVASGGNLLWLADPPFTVEAASLFNQLQLTPLAGRLLDSRSIDYGFTNPTRLLIRNFGSHDITQELQREITLTDSLAFKPAERSDWLQSTLLFSTDSSWNETGPIAGEVRMDPELGEQQGPHQLGFALSRLRPDQTQQQVVVIGDGDFLSNQFIGQNGNLDFGIRLVDWLLDTGEGLNIPARLTPALQLNMNPKVLGLLGLLMLFILPICLLLVAGRIYWRRRYA